MAIVGNNNSIKINELLCFFDNNFSNLAKSSMISTILNFSNEKEIFESRNILFQVGNDAITAISNDEAELDGWFTVLNNKGMLVTRRGSDDKTPKNLKSKIFTPCTLLWTKVWFLCQCSSLVDLIF